MPPKPPYSLREAIPVAGPATPALPVVPGEDGDVEDPWYTPGKLKSWATSLTLHAVILVAMGLWVFSPKMSPPRRFDTRLAGSEMGVEEGLTATGGLNTPLDLTVSESPPLEPMTAVPLKPMDVGALAPKLTDLAKSTRPSAGGGVENPNPGAGNGDGFGLARFGQGGENIRGVAVKVGDPQFTLLWDTEADLDLHVIEPGGKEIYWEDPKGLRGGELDVDNTKGFGPENIYWLNDVEGTEEKVKGAGPTGEYRWFVVYWGGFGGVARPTRWKVRIKHAGKVTIVTGKFKALNERSKMHTLRVDPAAAASQETPAR